jgi:hypothetical protein
MENRRDRAESEEPKPYRGFAQMIADQQGQMVKSKWQLAKTESPAHDIAGISSQLLIANY